MKKKSATQKTEDSIIQFDSCTALLNALARFLHNKNFAGVGVADNVPAWIGEAINLLPDGIRQALYSWSGWLDAIPSPELAKLRSENIARWVTGLYPQRTYPAIMFGSANGAAVHLAAALGIPWLPQTYLAALRRPCPPDEMKKDAQWGAQAIRPFLEHNPETMAVQMHDPVQDRLMIQKMAYFRLKRLTLGETFEHFIRHHRDPDAPLITIECTFPWPCHRVDDRHLFQVGGFGSLRPEEYLNGSDRVREFLRRVKAPVEGWDCPWPTEEAPEGEWGFTAACLEDIRRFARAADIPVRRLMFDHPEGLTTFVADLYDWWYQQRGIAHRRMIVENFGLVVPYDVLETAAIPFWLAFNTSVSADLLKEYLSGHAAFDEIYLMLMSNGVAEGIGLTPIDEWKRILGQARQTGRLIGVDEREYPLDFGTFVKYNEELKTAIPQRQPLPAPMTMSELTSFLDTHGGRYALRWETLGPAAS